MTARAAVPSEAVRVRTSDLLRSVLLANPNLETFTVGQILDALGAERTEASLVFFSMPSIVPAPGLPAFAGVSTGMIASQMAAGRKAIRLPKAVLNQRVPRRSLAVAVHALAPVMEAAEKVARPRLAWASCPLAKRMLGVLLFVLAVAIAFPVIGFDPLHAASVSAISLGLVEKDGVAILLGVMAGLISLALIVTSGLTARILKSKVVVWLRRLARRGSAKALAAVCERRGWTRLAAILRFDWQDILLAWDPERRAAEKARDRQARDSAGRDASGRPTTERRPRAASADAKRKAAPAVRASRSLLTA